MTFTELSTEDQRACKAILNYMAISCERDKKSFLKVHFSEPELGRHAGLYLNQSFYQLYDLAEIGYVDYTSSRRPVYLTMKGYRFIRPFYKRILRGNNVRTIGLLIGAIIAMISLFLRH